ncbi:molybdate ABC transporter substrate-binding protein [Marinomonas algicola]|uniref:molybdate ABC transporter substrate-binding protein n=1 Tax=Marinomonas algicola TaxID=2773454 RepID=UPI001EFF4874|nr:molybdate ABC transporter substrate-binding protein [Marinomonas algicola]
MMKHSNRHWLKGISVAFFLMFASYQTYAESALIAVATNFTPTMKSIVDAFHQDTKHNLRVSFAASGKLYAQIKNGAPFDLFMSADQAIPKRLIEEGNALEGSQVTYAEGKLVLWSLKEELIDNQGDILFSARFNKLALANPKLAPYGLAATEVLDHLNLTQDTYSRWVQGENIGQAYQFVRSGNADIGFIALSQIQFNQHTLEGSYWHVPESLYTPIKQDLVVLNKGEHNQAINDFLQYLASPKIQTLIQGYGYNTEQNLTLFNSFDGILNDVNAN